MHSLDPRRLQTFRVVAQSGRISEAARLLHLSQPAVTAQIRMLEESCGRPLFTRSGRGVVLNDAGRELLAYAVRLDELLEEASLRLEVGPAVSGELHVAASTTIAAYVLPQLLASFRRSVPGTRVRVEVGNTDGVLAMVGGGEVPLGLVEGHGRAPGLRLERYLEDELVAVVAPNAPAELLRVRRATDLVNVPIIWREPGSGTRAVVERALRKAGRRRPHPADIQLASTEGIKNAVALGLGLSILSRWSVRAELATGALRELELAGWSVTRSFSWALPANELAGMAGRFLAHARRFPPQAGSR